MIKNKIIHNAHLLTYAIDADGNLVYIDEVPNGNGCGCKCPGCGEPLMAKNKGERRIHHFAHQSGTECDIAYESMLHRLAKEKLQEAFLKNNDFFMEFEYRSYCPSKEQCHFITYGSCCTCEMRRFNLKDYYDSCEQERAYDKIRRRSDLKLFSSTNPKRIPIYIEFCVTHASDWQKLHSGNKIIEIEINDEGDIYGLVENGLQETSRCHTYDDKTSGGTKFYGFKKEDHNNKGISEDIEIVRYILFASGKSRCFIDICNCRNIQRVLNALFEVHFHTPSSFGVYDFAKYIGFQKFGIKNCLVCKNYVENYNGMGRICRLYKYLQIPRDKDFDTSRAKTCSCFTLNKEEMEKEMKNENNLKYVILE